MKKYILSVLLCTIYASCINAKPQRTRPRDLPPTPPVSTQMDQAAPIPPASPVTTEMVHAASSLEEIRPLISQSSTAHLMGVRELPLPTPPANSQDSQSTTSSPITDQVATTHTPTTDVIPILLATPATLEADLPSEQNFMQRSAHHSHRTTPEPQEVFDDQEASQNQEIPDDWQEVDITIASNLPCTSTTPKSTSDWFHAVQQWNQEHIQDTFLVEQCVTTLKVVTRYSVILTMIQKNKLRQFIDYFDTKSSGGGLRWLDKAINQAVDAQDESATRIILDKAKEEKFLDVMAESTKSKAEEFLRCQLLRKAQKLTDYLELWGKDVRDLATTIAQTQRVGTANVPPSLPDVEVRHQARALTQNLTQFSSSKTLSLPPFNKD